MKIEKNNIDVPLHLNEKFFNETLENGLHKNHIIIDNIIFEMGSETGENYCSKIYRVKIQYYEKIITKSSTITSSLKNISLIIKSIPINEANDFLNHLNVFLKEKIMYLDVLPKIETLVNHSKFGAKYVLHFFKN